MTAAALPDVQSATLPEIGFDKPVWWIEQAPLLVHMTGRDSEKFLQNRTSNDVAALQPGFGHWNSVLDKKAHIQGVFALGRDQQTHMFWLQIPANQWPAAEKSLFKYRIVEEIMAMPSSLQGVSLQGIQAGYLLARVLAPLLGKPIWQLAFQPNQLAWVSENLLVWRQDVLGVPGYTLWATEEKLAVLKQAFMSQAIQLSEAAFYEKLAESGFPQAEVDYDATTLLPETGLEAYTVSYSKGCYLGQETVARVKTYGSLPYAWVALIAETIVPVGELYLADTLPPQGKPIGRVTRSFQGHAVNQPVAMAYVDKMHRVPGKALTVVVASKKGVSEPMKVTVQGLPLHPPVDVTPLAGEILTYGLKAFADNQTERALEALIQAICLDATLLDAYEALGAVLGRGAERYAEAIEVTEYLATQDPDRVMAHTNLSVFYMQLGDKERAEDEKARATVLTMRQRMAAAGFQPAEADGEAMKVAQKKQLEERLHLFEVALANAPDDPLGNFGLGSTVLELAQLVSNPQMAVTYYLRAVAALEKTVGLPTSQSAAYLKLGQAYEGLNDTDKAKATYHEGVEVASRRRDLQPLNAMQARLHELEA